MNRCISPYSGMLWITSRRYALNVVPKSWIPTPDSRATIQLAQCDGILRSSKLSTRCVRHPLTTSYPSSSFARKLGISSGACCRSPSIDTSISPCAWSNPAASADVCPKFRRSLITSTRLSTAAISSSNRYVRSFDPSSTNTISNELPTCSITSFTRS